MCVCVHVCARVCMCAHVCVCRPPCTLRPPAKVRSRAEDALGAEGRPGAGEGLRPRPTPGEARAVASRCGQCGEPPLRSTRGPLPLGSRCQSRAGPGEGWHGQPRHLCPPGPPECIREVPAESPSQAQQRPCPRPPPGSLCWSSLGTEQEPGEKAWAEPLSTGGPTAPPDQATQGLEGCDRMTPQRPWVRWGTHKQSQASRG